MVRPAAHTIASRGYLVGFLSGLYSNTLVAIHRAIADYLNKEK